MCKLIVTEKNVKAVSTVDLVSRLKYLDRILARRNIHPQICSELLYEKELIKQTLIKRGKKNVIAEQTTLPGLEPPKVAAYKSIVISKLITFYKAEEEIKRLNNKLEKGLELTFPSISASYGNNSGVTVGFSEFQSKSERAVVMREEREDQILCELFRLEKVVEEVEKAMECLDPLELEYIERRYFTDKSLKKYEIIEAMGIGKTKFYEMQQKVYVKLAEALSLF